MTEPITAVGQLLDRYAEMRGLVIEARRVIDSESVPLQNDCDCQTCAIRKRIDAALARDITTALTAPDIQPQG